MVIEFAQVHVLPGHEQEFEEAIEQAARTVLPQVAGFQHFHATGWCLERPSVYAFQIAWATLEDHMEGFRGSELFTRWRDLIGPHVDGVPVVEHFAAR